MVAAPFRMSLEGNDSFMFADAPHCASCIRVLDGRWIDPVFRLTSSVLDLSVTYDGCVIASAAFAAACRDVSGVSFEPLAAEPGFYAMWVDQLLRVDPDANGTRFGELCEECGMPTYVVRPGPLHLVKGEEVAPGLSLDPPF